MADQGDFETRARLAAGVFISNLMGIASNPPYITDDSVRAVRAIRAIRRGRSI